MQTVAKPQRALVPPHTSTSLGLRCVPRPTPRVHRASRLTIAAQSLVAERADAVQNTGTVAPSRPKLEDDDAQSEAVPATDEPAFDWFRNWWPLALEADLDFERPNALQLLGKDIAVWRDTEGIWHAVHDLCPHRLAALSDGHISGQGDIVCPYHGWEFNGEGRCTHNPQAIDEAAERTACNSSRSRVASHPVQVQQGVLWLWGAGGSEEFVHSAAKSPAIAAEAEDPAWFAMPYGISQQVATSAEVMQENSFDPSHSNYVHGSTFQKREDAMPMRAKLITKIDRMAGFTVEHGPYSVNQKGLHVERTFLPPGCLRAVYKQGPMTTLFMVHSTPVRPGVSKQLFRVMMTPSKVPKAPSWFKPSLKLPAFLSGLLHVSQNLAADQDALVLHRQDQRLHRANVEAKAVGNRRGWRKYYMATPSDVAVDAYRRWIDMAGGEVPYEGNHPYPEEKTLAQLQNRWDRHVSICKQCQQTAAALTKISAGLGIAVWASGFAAVCLAATGSPALGAPTFLTVPVAVWVAAVTAGLAALRHTVDAKYKAFHIPERVGEYPLIRPASFSKPAPDNAA